MPAAAACVGGAGATQRGAGRHARSVLARPGLAVRRARGPILAAVRHAPPARTRLTGGAAHAGTRIGHALPVLAGLPGRAAGLIAADLVGAAGDVICRRSVLTGVTGLIAGINGAGVVVAAVRILCATAFDRRPATDAVRAGRRTTGRPWAIISRAALLATPTAVLRAAGAGAGALLADLAAAATTCAIVDRRLDTALIWIAAGGMAGITCRADHRSMRAGVGPQVAGIDGAGIAVIALTVTSAAASDRGEGALALIAAAGAARGARAITTLEGAAAAVGDAAALHALGGTSARRAGGDAVPALAELVGGTALAATAHRTVRAAAVVIDATAGAALGILAAEDTGLATDKGIAAAGAAEQRATAEDGAGQPFEQTTAGGATGEGTRQVVELLVVHPFPLHVADCPSADRPDLDPA